MFYHKIVKPNRNYHQIFNRSIKYFSSWIDQSSVIPKRVKPFLHLMRVDKQVGTLLLLWPCVWSTAIAAPLGCLPNHILLLKFAFGSFVMRSAGCIINDLWDKDYDKHVERTKSRPLARFIYLILPHIILYLVVVMICFLRGDVTVLEALGLLGINLSCGLVVLLSLNTESILLGLLSMPFVVVYPLMKRFSNWPQLILGLTFNWGALVGFTAASNLENSILYTIINDLSLETITNFTTTTLYTNIPSVVTLVDKFVSDRFIEQALPLYLSGVCWTLIYDTLYAYQDRKDDAQIGLKSTALTLGDHPQCPLTILSIGMYSGLLFAGYTASLTYPYYIGVHLMWGHTLWQIWSADINDPKNLWRRFNSNKYSGGLLSLAIIVGHF